MPFYGGMRFRDAITPSSKLSVFIGHFDMTEPADAYLIRVIDLWVYVLLVNGFVEYFGIALSPLQSDVVYVYIDIAYGYESYV